MGCFYVTCARIGHILLESFIHKTASVNKPSDVNTDRSTLGGGTGRTFCYDFCFIFALPAEITVSVVMRKWQAILTLLTSLSIVYLFFFFK